MLTLCWSFWHKTLYALIYLQIKSQCFAHFSEKPEAACPTRKVTRLGLKGTLRNFATDLLLNLSQVISFLCASSFLPILCVFYSGCKFFRAAAVLWLCAGPVPPTAVCPCPPSPPPAGVRLLDATATQKIQSLNNLKEFDFYSQDLHSLACFLSIKLFRRGTSYQLTEFPVQGLK